MNLDRVDQRWVAIQVRPRYELITAQILGIKGYEQFVPMYRSLRRWSDREKILESPLFAGYVFCRLSQDIQWPIVTTPGVIRLVKDGAEIAIIDDSGIEAIRVIERLQMRGEPCSYPKVSERVRVVNGPLTGLEGLLVKHKKDGRLVLSIDAIQRCISVEIAECDVVSIGSATKLPSLPISSHPNSIAS